MLGGPPLPALADPDQVSFPSFPPETDCHLSHSDPTCIRGQVNTPYPVISKTLVVVVVLGIRSLVCIRPLKPAGWPPNHCPWFCIHK